MSDKPALKIEPLGWATTVSIAMPAELYADPFLDFRDGYCRENRKVYRKTEDSGFTPDGNFVIHDDRGLWVMRRAADICQDHDDCVKNEDIGRACLLAKRPATTDP